MSSSLFLQQCPACLVRQTCIVFVMGGKWPYSWTLLDNNESSENDEEGIKDDFTLVIFTGYSITLAWFYIQRKRK